MRVATRRRAGQRTERDEDIRDTKISQEWAEIMRCWGSVWRRVKGSTPEKKEGSSKGSSHLHNQHRPFLKNAVCL